MSSEDSNNNCNEGSSSGVMLRDFNHSNKNNIKNNEKENGEATASAAAATTTEEEEEGEKPDLICGFGSQQRPQRKKRGSIFEILGSKFTAELAIDRWGKTTTPSESEQTTTTTDTSNDSKMNGVNGNEEQQGGPANSSGSNTAAVAPSPTQGSDNGGNGPEIIPVKRRPRMRGSLCMMLPGYGALTGLAPEAPPPTSNGDVEADKNSSDSNVESAPAPAPAEPAPSPSPAPEPQDVAPAPAPVKRRPRMRGSMMMMMAAGENAAAPASGGDTAMAGGGGTEQNAVEAPSDAAPAPAPTPTPEAAAPVIKMGGGDGGQPKKRRPRMRGSMMMMLAAETEPPPGAEGAPPPPPETASPTIITGTTMSSSSSTALPPPEMAQGEMNVARPVGVPATKRRSRVRGSLCMTMPHQDSASNINAEPMTGVVATPATTEVRNSGVSTATTVSMSTTTSTTSGSSVGAEGQAVASQPVKRRPRKMRGSMCMDMPTDNSATTTTSAPTTTTVPNGDSTVPPPSTESEKPAVSKKKGNRPRRRGSVIKPVLYDPSSAEPTESIQPTEKAEHEGIIASPGSSDVAMEGGNDGNPASNSAADKDGDDGAQKKGPIKMKSSRKMRGSMCMMMSPSDASAATSTSSAAPTQPQSSAPEQEPKQERPMAPVKMKSSRRMRGSMCMMPPSDSGVSASDTSANAAPPVQQQQQQQQQPAAQGDNGATPQATRQAPVKMKSSRRMRGSMCMMPPSSSATDVTPAPTTQPPPTEDASNLEMSSSAMSVDGSQHQEVEVVVDMDLQPTEAEAGAGAGEDMVVDPINADDADVDIESTVKVDETAADDVSVELIPNETKEETKEEGTSSKKKRAAPRRSLLVMHAAESGVADSSTADMNMSGSTLNMGSTMAAPRRGSVIKPRTRFMPTVMPHGGGGGVIGGGGGGEGASVSDVMSTASSKLTGSSSRTLPGSKERRHRGGRKAIHAVAAEMDYVKKSIPKSSTARELIYESIKPNLLFRTCSEEELFDLVDVFEPSTAKAGSVIIQEGTDGDHFYVMERGGVNVYENEEFKCSLYSGVAFGEIALLYGCPRSATVEAKYDCKLWSIDRRAFRGITLHHKRRRLERKEKFLRKVKISNKVLGEVLKASEIHAMALATQTETFREGDDIVRQGEKGDAFYMIEEGHVNVYIKEKGELPVVTLESGQFFGEKALLADDVRTATCIAATNVKCMYLMREDFVLMLGDLQDLLDRSYANRRDSLLSMTDGVTAFDDNFEGFTVDDFEVKRTLGVGAFGYVKLVKLKTSSTDDDEELADELFALKCISKKKIAELKQEEKIASEEAIMSELMHPFIVRCYSAMHDDKAKYFLMEALCGGELCEILFDEEAFSEEWTRFYSASVLHALTHMHNRKIAYRDLKTENLVLNERGYVKVVDFGLAKKIPSGKTWTFCGTPDYLAPEIILNEGHDWAVDYWAFGVLLFELTSGEAPFCSDKPMEVYEKVLAGELTVPDHFTIELEDLIAKLLNKFQSKRLGRTIGGGRAVMQHEWFADFDWEDLLAYKMKVPFVPEKKDPDDNTGFDDDDDEGFAEPV